MLDEAIWRGRQTPGPQQKKSGANSVAYNPEKTREFLRAKSKSTLIYPRTRVKGQQIPGSRAGSKAAVIKKEETKISYDVAKSIEKTQWTNTEFKFTGKKRESIFEFVARSKAKIPGPGHYVNKEKSFERLSSPPFALKRRR